MKKRHFYYSIDGIFFLVLFCCSTNTHAQNAGDEVLATWNPMSHDYQSLYKTRGNYLIYKRSDSESDADFYVRQTVLLSDITSITREESDYGNDFVFKVETKEN